MAKKKKRKVKKSLTFILLIIVLVGGFVCFKKINKKTNQPTTEIEVVDTIDTFDYVLNDNETKYYNELFNSLKELLAQENYDEQEYAVLISKLFLADFYDLDSKIMKSDVGGTQFVYSEYRNDFELGAIDTVYKFVESNVYSDRKQELPTVKNVEKANITTDSYKSNMVTDSKAYYVTMDINYNKDLGYPKSVQLVLVHNQDKLEIVKMETK